MAGGLRQNPTKREEHASSATEEKTKHRAARVGPAGNRLALRRRERLAEGRARRTRSHALSWRGHIAITPSRRARRPLLASLLLRFASSVRGVLLLPLARPLACAGELTAVHQLPALRFPPLPPRCCSTCSCRHWHLCSANESTMVGCDWRGPSVEEPLHHTHMHTLESIVWNRFLECSAGEDLRLPTMHLIPYPATDIMHKIQ